MFREMLQAAGIDILWPFVVCSILVVVTVIPHDSMDEIPSSKNIVYLRQNS